MLNYQATNLNPALTPINPQRLTYMDVDKVMRPEEFFNIQPLIANKIHGQVCFLLFRNM
jgi:hypothetical protein